MLQRQAPLRPADPAALRRTRAGLGWAAAVSLTALLGGWTAQAQQSDGLRGTGQAESAATADPLATSAQPATDTADAEPDGPVDGGDNSLFDDPIDGAPPDGLFVEEPGDAIAVRTV